MENSVFRTSSDCKKYIDGNFSVLISIITSVCKKLYHIVSDCEECVSDLLLKIVENDYEILRSFPGGKDYKFATYLFTVLYRKAIDIVRIKEGHYRPSTKAKKLGRCTVELEKQLYYSSTLQEAHQTMLNIEECKNITFDDAQKIENKIRRKSGKPKPTTEYVSRSVYCVDYEEETARAVFWLRFFTSSFLVHFKMPAEQILQACEL